MPSFGRFPTRPWATLALLFLIPAASAQGIADLVTVNDPYVRAVPPMVKTSAAYMQLQSRDQVERFLVDASTPIAGAVELHMHIHDGGVMRMRRIPHIHLPPQATVSLVPGGEHIMLFDLNTALIAGARVPLTLIFDDGSRKEIQAEVRGALAD
jgi:copper(I)-binding protein